MWWERYKHRLILRTVLGAAFAVIASAWYTTAEFAYLAFGETTTATVTRITHVTDGRGLTGRPVQLVTAVWADPDGTPRKDDVTAPASTALRVGGPITLRATPGVDGRARVAGQVNWSALAVFTAAVVSGLGLTLWLYREYAAGSEPRRPKGSRKSR